jgi:amidase
VLALDPTALDQARALDRSPAPRGPIWGMPIMVKDNIETRGPLPTTAGSLALVGNVTGRDAPLVARLRPGRRRDRR